MKKILVIGATGAQGAAVVRSLAQDGSYQIRALTRNSNSKHAQELAALKNVELMEGSFTNEADLRRAFTGVNAAYVNVDGFAIGEKAEIFWGIRIFEIATEIGTVDHFVWSNLDYAYKKSGYNPKYHAAHYDGKGRVGEWIASQSNKDSKMKYSLLTSGPYMDMLWDYLGPVESDGIYKFIAPIGQHGAIPMIALEDLGWYARWIFDHPEKSAGLDLEIATQEVSWPELVETFTRVTGKPAEFVDVSYEEFSKAVPADEPVAHLDPSGMTTRQNFQGWWNMWHDRLLKRDYERLYALHPRHLTLESWMIKEKYTGASKPVLKDVHDQTLGRNRKDRQPVATK